MLRTRIFRAGDGVTSTMIAVSMSNTMTAAASEMMAFVSRSL